MADPEVGCNYVYLSLLLVLSWASVTWAQTFQKPSIDTPTTMTEGTQYTISCSCISTGENVSLALKRSDQSNVISRSTQCKVVAGDTILCNSIYEFTARREDNGVQVICTAVQTGNPESKSDTTILDVLAKPRSSVSNTVIKATIGTEVTLNCETDANPPATHFNWSFDAVALNETGFSLILTPTNTSFGEYTCNATNTIGTSDPIAFILEEKPLAKPRSNISNYVISASIGMTVNLTCATNANPPATDHEWSFGGVTLNATESSLEITLTDDSLFGVYTCVAVNRVGKSDPIVLILQERNLMRPRSNVNTPITTATIGTTVTLTCQTVANPPATKFSWSFEGVTLNETGSSLVINLTDSSFFGEYTCFATNKVGTSDPIVLTVDPESSTVEPHSSTVELESSTVEPEFSTVELVSSTVEMEPSNVEPESSTAEPEFSTVELVSSTVEKEPSNVEPESSTAGVESSTVKLESSTAEVESSTVKLEPTTVAPKSTTSVNKPEPATGNIALLIGGCAGGFVVFTVLAAGLIFICRNRRRCCVTNHVDSAVKGNPRELKTSVSYTVPGTGNLFAVIQKRKPGVKPKNRKGRSAKV